MPAATGPSSSEASSATVRPARLPSWISTGTAQASASTNASAKMRTQKR
ncbi:Uncharacterised protein [Bordetella pertussis]|nr:Uncharacterised protein [Bordetella pertussis]